MRQVILLRGVNLGPANRVPMAALREQLAVAGLSDAQTYVQSGNVVVDTELTPAALVASVERVLQEQFGLSVPVITRSAQQLAAVVSRNPFPEHAAADPKHVQVTFLAGEGDAAAIEALQALPVGKEKLLATPTELYSWHPDGIARSKLALGLTAAALKVQATARNWATVTTLLGMASDGV